jgi:hypothetical protein
MSDGYRYHARKQNVELKGFKLGWLTFPHAALKNKSVLSDFIGLFLFAGSVFSFVPMVCASSALVPVRPWGTMHHASHFQFSQCRSMLLFGAPQSTLCCADAVHHL